MDNLDKNQNGESVNRILWYDPNYSNNVMVNPEDLSIKVEFTTYRKNRTIIYAGTEVNNTGGSEATVRFIEGSKVSDAVQPSLTTRYTDAVTLEVMNDGKQNDDDFESLGIESIDIEFNTAFQPIIKIKFIDVRGQAILQQGNMSKYRMFFDLPYPIFNLKVKGFYGKTVSYCLHMQRWNASFNSNTGNFEIQADFLGYTYAILTDMLLGLIRASVRTKKGIQKLEDKRKEYGNNSDLVLTIDEMLKRLIDLNYSVKKISDDDDSASQLQNYDKIFSGINDINNALVSLKNSTYDGETPYFTSESYFCVPTTTREKYEKALTTYTDTITPLINSVNLLIDNDDSLKLKDYQLTNVVHIKDVTKKVLKDKDTDAIIVGSKSSKIPYSNNDVDKERILELFTNIGTLGGATIGDNINFDIYNFKRIDNYISDIKTKLESNKSITEQNLTEEISNVSDETLGFEPNIRNIFRVLSINTEIFLEVLKEVSADSQKVDNDARKNEFKKIIGTNSSFNLKPDDIKNLNIYPWPEYREKKNDKNNDGFVEAWIGAAPGVNGDNINEVAFVNEMHTELLNVAKFDKELNELIANQEAGIDIDKQPNTIDNAWFPVSVADTPVDPRMTENPYILATQSKITDDIDRLVLMRTFLLLGVSTYNNKLTTTNGFIQLMGRFEAENLLAAARKLGPDGQVLINEYLSRFNLEESTDDDIVSKYVSKTILGVGLSGSDKIKNPGGVKKKPIMIRVTKGNVGMQKTTTTTSTTSATPFNQNNSVISNPLAPQTLTFNTINNIKNGKVTTTTDTTPADEFYYKYTYIRNEYTRAAYIPVNKNFDGTGFYGANDKFVTIDRLKELSNDVLFVSTPKNLDSSNIFFKTDDGSLHVKIYDLSEYTSKSMVPPFGADLLKAYASGIVKGTNDVLRVNGAYGALIETGRTDESVVLQGFQPYTGNYSAPEFTLLNYQDTNRVKDYYSYIGDPSWKFNEPNVDSSLLAFYTQFTKKRSGFPAVGTYLSTINKNLKDAIKQGNYSVLITKKNNNDVIQYSTTLDKTTVDVLTFEAPDCDTCFNKRDAWLDNGNYMKNKSVISRYINNSAKAYLPFIEYGTSSQSDNDGDKTISLFGSYFYYLQTSDEVKALLFLHTIPWQGVKNMSDNISDYFMLDKSKDWTEKDVHYTNKGFIHNENDIESNSITRVLSIRTLFQGHGGFIGAPKAWVLFIGAMLWRLRQEDEPIKFVSKGKNQNEEYQYTEINLRPKKHQYLYFASDKRNDYDAERNPWGMFFGYSESSEFFAEVPDSVRNDRYVPMDKTIRNLPKQVRDEFVNYFLNWVKSDDGFQYIKKELELTKENNYDSTGRTKWFNTYNKLKGEVVNIESNDGKEKSYIALSELNNAFTESVVKNYDLITPSSDLKGTYALILKPETKVMDSIVELITTPVIIQNVNPNIWHYDYYDSIDKTTEAKYAGYEEDRPSKSIRVRADKYRSFLFGFYQRLLTVNKDFQKEILKTEDDQTEQEIFGTSDDKTIKLQIYRKLSAINDKWINGSSTSGPFSQCGSSSDKTNLDFGKKYRPNGTEVSLIDTFRFVDRAFRDIGDKFFIDINQVNNLIRGNYNQSFFDIANQILTDNNFNFIPLPNFINFNSISELQTVFTPYNYNDVVSFTGTGPSFLCTYVGQTSTNLDLGENSAYPDDGLSFSFENNRLVYPEQADDFSGNPDFKNGDMYAPVFAVNYGQQNQNYFKNIKLDQREFAETMESLEIIEAISQTGDKSKPTYAGNNLFGVYQTRSYSAEVEMMGSAMIQPMMYFQLNNIPMFRGAYLIYKVNHKITPHNMVTNFKGNRVKRTKTPLLDKATMYMNLIGTQAGGAQISSQRQTSGTFAPIVQTIIDNGGRNGDVNKGNITLSPIDFSKIKGIGDPFNKKNETSENKLITEAIVPLTNMLNDWVKWMRDEQKFKGNNGNYAYITSIFRDFDKQVQVKKDRGNAAAPPGTSPHGWGIAIDLQYFDKNGTLISNIENTPEFFKYGTNPAIQWLFDHSYMYGWVLPYTLRDGAGLDEHWHWEYHGTAAKCLVEKNPNVYGQKINTGGAVKSFVKNPKDSTGKEAVYTGCNYKYIKMGDGNENCPELITEPKKQYTTKEIYTAFKQNTQFNDYAIAGIMANMFAESSFTPQAFNSGGGGCGAYGLAQWRGARITKLSNYAKSKNLPIDSIVAQIGYLAKEIQDTYTYTFSALKNISNAELAAKVVHNTYEATNFGVTGFKMSSIENQTLTYNSNGKTIKVICPSVRTKKANEYYTKIKNGTI